MMANQSGMVNTGRRESHDVIDTEYVAVIVAQCALIYQEIRYGSTSSCFNSDTCSDWLFTLNINDQLLWPSHMLCHPVPRT